MAPSNKISNEHLSTDEEHVAFTFTNGDEKRSGQISRSALVVLDGPAGNHLMWIFVHNLDRIAEAALDYWHRNPNAKAISLGSSDF